ncbi:MAG: DUF488 domain-containing protein [Hyphomicrobiales bacterium]
MTAKSAWRDRREGLRIKRVYEPAAASDGVRVLVDRLWPRGLSKEKARVDLWLKDIAPSDMLRRQMHGGEIGWDQFEAAYSAELAREPARSAAQALIDRIEHGRVTLLYAARDETRNNAVALKRWIEEQSR